MSFLRLNRDPDCDSGRYRPDGSTDFLQWWYFDAEFASGHHMMVTLMPRTLGRIDGDDNGPDPGISLTLTGPDLKNYRSREYYPGKFHGDTERMFARFADNTVEYRDGRFHLSVLQQGIGCDLEYIPRYPPWAPLPGRGGYMARPLVCLSQRSLDRNRYFHYASMIPRGRVRGRLTLPGGAIDVEGEGYHEQGRTNSPLHKVFTCWYWTRFFLGDWTFIFPVGESPRATLNAKMRALLVRHREQVVADLFDVTGLVLNHRVKRFVRHPESGREDLPGEAVFSARWPGFRLEAAMALFHQREYFRFSPFTSRAPGAPAWFQHLMRVKVRMRLRGKPIDLEGTGVFETMFTGAR
jgi:hypothetical protein